MDYICVWEFRSVDGKQVVRSIRSAYPDDQSFAHEYQRIVYRGPRSGYVASK
jgi:hypothetical protein